MLEGRKDGVCLEQPTVVDKGLELKMISCFDSGDRSCTLTYTHTHKHTKNVQWVKQNIVRHQNEKIANNIISKNQRINH